jgi:hypothetical protein
METKERFILLEPSEFSDWLNLQNVTRKIQLIQQHHTYAPSYKDFNGNNHVKLCENMRNYHVNVNGWQDIAQNFTIFPDGKIVVCRSINTIPAGIKGVNTYGICIENIGNFDKDNDIMNEEQKQSIILVAKILLENFSLKPSDQSIVYHHWYDLNTNKRITVEGQGVTKSCPGTNFFGGNTIVDFNKHFLPLIFNT